MLFRSGAGKTTLLRMVAGLQAMSSGRLWMEDIDVSAVPPESRSCGWVGAEPGLIPGLDALGQVELPLRLAGMVGGERRGRSLHALQTVGLGHRIDHLPHQLSSGEALRVAIARATVHRPRLLLMDEPFARVDPVQRLALRRCVDGLRAETGCTVIETSHWLSEALNTASHMAILRGGRLVQFGDAEATWRHPCSPWVMDYLSTIPNWWSPHEARFTRGWHEDAASHPPPGMWLGEIGRAHV